MQKKILYPIALLVLLICQSIFTGCSKESGTKLTYNTMSVDTALIHRYLFRTGSWWVYERENGSGDSVVVANIDSGYAYIPCPHGCPGGIATRIELYFMSMLDVSANGSFNYTLMFDYIKLNGGGSYGELGQPVFLYKATEGYSFNGATVLERADSMTVKGTTYHAVTHMRITAGSQYQHEYKFDTDLWFSDNVGLIRQVTNDTVHGVQSWDLLRYQVKM